MQTLNFNPANNILTDTIHPPVLKVPAKVFSPLERKMNHTLYTGHPKVIYLLIPCHCVIYCSAFVFFFVYME